MVWKQVGGREYRVERRGAKHPKRLESAKANPFTLFIVFGGLWFSAIVALAILSAAGRLFDMMM